MWKHTYPVNTDLMVYSWTTVGKYGQLVLHAGLSPGHYFSKLLKYHSLFLATKSNYFGRNCVEFAF